MYLAKDLAKDMRFRAGKAPSQLKLRIYYFIKSNNQGILFSHFGLFDCIDLKRTNVKIVGTFHLKLNGRCSLFMDERNSKQSDSLTQVGI